MDSCIKQHGETHQPWSKVRKTKQNKTKRVFVEERRGGNPQGSHSGFLSGKGAKELELRTVNVGRQYYI